MYIYVFICIYMYICIYGYVEALGYPVTLRSDLQHPSGWWGGAQPRKEGLQGIAPRLFVFDNFGQNWKQILHF